MGRQTKVEAKYKYKLNFKYAINSENFEAWPKSNNNNNSNSLWNPHRYQSDITHDGTCNYFLYRPLALHSKIKKLCFQIRASFPMNSFEVEFYFQDGDGLVA